MSEYVSVSQGDIPGALSCRQLSDIATLEWGNTSITKKSYVDAGFTAISAAGPDGLLDHFEWSGDGVVLSAIGARCGRCFHVSGNWTAIKNTIVIQGDPACVNHKFLYYYLNDARKWKISGSGQPFITLKTARETAVPFPAIQVQVEIVAEIEKQFSRLDEAVANLQRVKANLKRYKASVLKAAVEGRLVETEATLAHREGRSYETGEQLLQRILEARRSQWQGKTKYKEPSPVDQGWTAELPTGWAWATMAQLGQVQLGKMLDKQKHSAGKPYRYLRNINVRWGAFDLSDLFEMNFEPDQLDRFGVCDGDVFVCEGGEPARAAVWRMGKTDIKYQKALHRVRFDGAFVPELFAMVLEHLAKSGALERLYGGSTIKHFTLEVFLTLNVPVPPLAEQQRIVAEADRRLSIIREVEVEVDANLQRAQALRHATLNKMFGGARGE